jgi:hypothetical protein
MLSTNQLYRMIPGEELYASGQRNGPAMQQGVRTPSYTYPSPVMQVHGELRWRLLSQLTGHKANEPCRPYVAMYMQMKSVWVLVSRSLADPSPAGTYRYVRLESAPNLHRLYTHNTFKYTYVVGRSEGRRLRRGERYLNARWWLVVARLCCSQPRQMQPLVAHGTVPITNSIVWKDKQEQVTRCLWSSG